MKTVKWRILLVTALVCLMPILLGVSLWDKLPETMAIHFNINNEPDNFASREFVVFGLPGLMMLFQIVCCVANDLGFRGKKNPKKVEIMSKWILPVMSVVLYVAIIGYGLGWQFEMHRVAALVVGVMLLVTGNYLPKLDYVKRHQFDTQQARKINRFLGFETVILGLLFLGCVFLPSVATLACVCLLIPYSIIGVIYAIAVTKKQEE